MHSIPQPKQKASAVRDHKNGLESPCNRYLEKISGGKMSVQKYNSKLH